MTINVPLTVVIALLGVFITARFQRLHWLRATREEVRVRETKEATELVQDIARTFDKRIVAQRGLLRNLENEDKEAFKTAYRSAVSDYSERFNEIRYRLFYYTSYRNVLDFEEKLHNRLVHNAEAIENLKKNPAFAGRSVASIDEELSVVSAHVYMYCRNLASEISNENIGSLRKIKDWKNSNNEYITSWELFKRLLNI